MDAEWSSEVGITNIICVTDPQDPDKPHTLLKAKVRKDGSDPKTAIHWLAAEDGERKTQHEKAAATDILALHEASSSIGGSSPSPTKASTSRKKWEPLHIVCAVECDDDDRTPESWNNLSKAIPTILPHFLRLLKVSPSEYAAYFHHCIRVHLEHPPPYILTNHVLLLYHFTVHLNHRRAE